MNSWIILLLLCCCGSGNKGHDHCEEHSHCHKHCVEPRVEIRNTCEKETAKETCYERVVNDCGCKKECENEPVWKPYSCNESREDYCEHEHYDEKVRCNCGCNH